MPGGGFCTECGTPLGVNSRFCSGCGQPVEGTPSDPGTGGTPEPAASRPAPTTPARPAATPRSGGLTGKLAGRMGGKPTSSPMGGAPVPGDASVPGGVVGVADTLEVSSTPGPSATASPTPGPTGAAPPGFPGAAPTLPGGEWPGSATPTGGGAPPGPPGVPGGSGLAGGPPEETSATPAKSGGMPSPLLIGGAVSLVLVLIVVGFLVVGRGGGSGSIPNETGYGGLASLQSGPSSEPGEKKWSQDCDGSCSIAADSDRVYVLDTSDDDSTLVAYAKSDGKQAWKANGIESGTQVQVLGDTVIVTGQDSDGTRTLAFSAPTGKKRWDKDLSATVYASGTTMLLHDDEAADAGDVVVTDIESGDKKWAKPGIPVGLCNSHVVALDGDQDDTQVVVYDLGSGQKNVSIPTDELNFADVSCSDDGVFVLEDEEVSAYSFGDAKKRWTEKVSDATGLTAGIGLVFVGRSDGVRALSASKGEEKWRADDLSGANSGDDGSGAVGAMPISSSLVVVSGSNRETVVEASSGDEAGSKSVRGDAVAITAKGEYGVHGDSLSFYGFKTLDEKWSADLSDVDTDDGVSGMAVGGGYVFVVTGDEIQAYK